MPWRVVGVFVILLIYTLFASFNIDHKSDISIIFFEFKEIPIFVITLMAFILGGIVVLPFTVGRNLWRKRAQKRKTALSLTKKSLKNKSKSKSKLISYFRDQSFPFRKRKNAERKESESKWDSQ